MSSFLMLSCGSADTASALAGARAAREACVLRSTLVAVARLTLSPSNAGGGLLPRLPRGVSARDAVHLHVGLWMAQRVIPTNVLAVWCQVT